MTKPLNRTITPVPEDAQSHKGPGSTPSDPLDTTKGHRDDEKHNIREQAAHGNLVQNTSHRRSAAQFIPSSFRDIAKAMGPESITTM
jgi:hypothetical protein